jgi:hypothetical protein
MDRWVEVCERVIAAHAADRASGIRFCSTGHTGLTGYTTILFARVPDLDDHDHQR